MNKKPLELTFDTPHIDGTASFFTCTISKDIITGEGAVVGSIIFDEFHVSPQHEEKASVNFKVDHVLFVGVQLHDDWGTVRLSHVKPGRLYNLEINCITGE